MPEVLERRSFKPYGKNRDVWHAITKHPEILVEGPAGTGKSRSIAELLVSLCDAYPNSRGLIVRQTRKSLNESFMETLENQVLGAYEHPAVAKRIQRSSRDSYDFPNGARMILAGMDQPTRLRSAEFDWVFGNELTEMQEEGWEELDRAIRGSRMGFNFKLGDTNPDTELHWANQRCLVGKMHRITTTHDDNPFLPDGYLERLSGLGGVRRLRLFEGKWASSEGMIWPGFTYAQNILSEITFAKTVRIKWYLASIDWGYRNPGCLQVWGVDREGKMYRVAEIYRAGEYQHWWAERLCQLNKRYPLKIVACDPEDAEAIDLFNDHLRDAGMPAIAGKADNSWLAGRDLTGKLIASGDMVWVEGAHPFGKDANLQADRKAASSEEEIPSYQFKQTQDGRWLEKASEKYPDHGCDATRYAAMACHGQDFDQDTGPRHERGTFGQMLGHETVETSEHVPLQENPW